MSSAIKSAIKKDKPGKEDSVREDKGDINQPTSHKGTSTSADNSSSTGGVEDGEPDVTSTSSDGNKEESSAGADKEESLEGGESDVSVITRTDCVSSEDVIDITDEPETKADVEDITDEVEVKEDVTVEDITDEAEEKSLCGLCLGILQGLCAHDCAQRVSQIKLGVGLKLVKGIIGFDASSSHLAA